VRASRNDGKLRGGEGSEKLHKPSSTPLCVNLLKPLFLLSLVDNANGGHKESQKDGHKSVNSRENGIQSIVGPLGYGGHTERLGLGDKIRIGAECSAHLNKIRCVEVTTALEHILDCNPSAGSLLRPAGVEVVSQPESKEPDDRTCSSQIDHSNYEQPVEEHEATGDVVPLNHGSDRERPGNEKEYG